MKIFTKKAGFGVRYLQFKIYPFLVRAMSKNYDLKSRQYMPKTIEFERNLKHYKFWEYIYWRHGKATLT